MDDDWQPLGTVAPALLADARLQLHWAAQAAAAPGKQLLPHQADYGEQSFRWMRGPRALAQGLIEGARPFRSALRPAAPALVLLDGEGAAIEKLPLPGRTLEEVYGWLEGGIERLLGRPLERPLERPGELPAHPVGSGRPFGAPGALGEDDPAFAEVGRWFAFADQLLGELAARQPGASPVRCWPHHFDIATSIPLDPPGSREDPESARSIGVGLSPGDAGRAAPYLYVTPWPYPRDAELPAVDGGGVWHREGWMGAVLEGPALLDGVREGRGRGDARAQAERFLDSAVAACRRLLGTAG
jgi:hypothetical protein